MRVWAMCLTMVASASAQATIFLPIDVDGLGTDADRVKTAIQAEASRALKSSVVELDGAEVSAAAASAGVDACVSNAACVSALIEAHDDSELVQVSARRTGDLDPWAVVQLRIFGSAGVATFESEQSISGDTDVRALMLRAFAPARSTARLDIVGVVDGDVVLIDDIVGATTSLLSAGPHRVQVVHSDGSATTTDIVLKYDEQRVLELQANAPAEVRASPPLAVVAGGVVAGVGVVGVVASALQVAALAPILAEDERALGSCPKGDQDPNGHDFNRYGISPLGACNAVVVAHFHSTQSQSDTAMTALVVSSVFVVVGGVVAAAPFVFSQVNE